MLHTYVHKSTAEAATALTVAQVAKAYNFPAATGKGVTVGIIELGGGFNPTDFPGVTAVPVGDGSNSPDGPNGADMEVQLDIEVVQQVAPGAAIRVYFAPNTDAGFIAAIHQARLECQVITISWGQAENQWAAASIKKMSAELAAARAAGVNVFCASGDSGADDGTSAPVTDYPASDPSVVGCGGTRLTLTSSGSRSAEVTWDDNDTTSASGGGVSAVFPGRDVPDVAGNADPNTGYKVTVDGESFVVGGTSAVAPLNAGLCALLLEAYGAFDFLKSVTANPTVCYDVTAGDNGAFRAGPGRDETTGFGVVDGSLLLAALGGTSPTPPPPPPPPADAADVALAAAFDAWKTSYWARHTKAGKNLVAKGNAWEQARGYEAAT